MSMEITVEPVARDIARRLGDVAAPHKIGLIILSSDMVVERDFAMMLPPGGEVAYFTTRVEYLMPANEENLLRMEPHLAKAASLILPTSAMDVIAYCCTSASVVIGPEEIERQVRKGRPDVAVLTPITAAISGFAALDVNRISLMTPYTQDITQKMASYISDQGIDVLNASCFEFLDDQDMARITPDQIFDAGLAATHPDADALFISCTGIRSAETVDRLEQKIGKPVFSSNQCLFWNALRRTGYAKPVHGYGRLLRTQ